MTSILSQPTNKNYLQSNKWSFTLANSPHTVYFCQSIVLPGVSVGEAMVPTPFSDTYRHGDKMVFESLTLTVLIDEDMRTWEEIFNWMKGLSYPNDFREYQEQKKKGLYTDAVLEPHTNNHTSNFRIHFRECFPTSIGPVTFSYTDDPNLVLSTDVTIRYDTFYFERIT